MISNDPIDRRTALRSAVALGASGTLLLLRDFDAIASPLPTCDRPEDIASQLWSIRAGSGLGPISLGLRQHQVADVLGAPQDTLDFPGATIEELRKALGDLYDPERHSAVAPRFFLKYLDMGVSVEIMEGTVSEINAFTGHLSGYQKGDYAPFQGRFASEAMRLVSTLDEIVDALGPPCHSGHNERADIPKDWLHYYRTGIKFDFNAETKRLSCVSVCPADG